MPTPAEVPLQNCAKKAQLSTAMMVFHSFLIFDLEFKLQQ